MHYDFVWNKTADTDDGDDDDDANDDETNSEGIQEAEFVEKETWKLKLSKWGERDVKEWEYAGTSRR